MKTICAKFFHALTFVILALSLVSAGIPAQAKTAQAEPQVVEMPSMLQFTSGGHILGFDATGVYLATGSHALREEFLGTAGVAPVSDQAASEDRQAAPLGTVTYPDLWEGISLTYDSPPGGIIRSTYQVEAGADPAKIALRYNAPVSLDKSGNLLFEFETGSLTASAPIAWQDINGKRINVDVVFQTSEVLETSEVSFSVSTYNPAYPLTIDPTIVWNTFLGGSGIDYGMSIAVDGSGNVYVSGYSDATWGSPVRAHYGSTYDAFVAKLDPAGALTWNTFLGGSGVDYGRSIAVDGSGNVYMSGDSSATWGSPVRAYSSHIDAFAAKLDSSGALTWNTFLGTIGEDNGFSIAIDGSGNSYVGGRSRGTTWGSPVRAYSGGSGDAFAAKLDSAGALTWNTFLGGSWYDTGSSIAVDGSGNVYVSGAGQGTWGSPVRPHTDGYDAFAAKLNSAGALTWNTFLGGINTDYGSSIAVDGSGNVYVSGYSYVTWGSPVRAFTASGNNDTFAAKLDSSGALTWNTFLGGSGIDEGISIAVDGSGNVYVGGFSTATWGSPVRAYSGGYDAFAAKLNSAGALRWNTFLGGSNTDTGSSIAVDGSGNVFVSGASQGTWGSPVRAYAGGHDAYVVKLDNIIPTVLFGANTIPANGAVLTTGPTQIFVEFSSAVTNLTAELEANYLLVEAYTNGKFDTTSCNVPGSDTAAPDDVKIKVDTATYLGSTTYITTLGINGGVPLPAGKYRLFICGTTSIENADGILLNDGADSILTFTVAPAASSLPATGFRHERVTALPEQPVNKAYADTAMMLEIPKLSVSIPIVGVPHSENGWDVRWLGNSAGYLAGSAFPTWAGNTVITGHVWDAYNNPGIFSELKTLKYGDQVQIQAWGLTYTYEVQENNFVLPSNIRSVLKHEDLDWVTLLTCEFYNPLTGNYILRRNVRAVLVSVK